MELLVLQKIELTLILIIVGILLVSNIGLLPFSNSIDYNYDNSVLQHIGDNLFSIYATNNIENDSQISNNSNNKLSSLLREMGLLDSNVTSLESQFVKEYPMPSGTWPNSIMVDRNGIVWTVGTMSNTLISFDPGQGKIESIYPIPEKIVDSTNTKSKNQPTRSIRMVWSIVEDKDGFIWFSHGGSLWKFDPSSGHFELISEIRRAPFQMKIDNSTGNIWFTTFSGSTIGVIQKIDNTSRGNNLGNDTTARINNTIDSSENNEYEIVEFSIDNNETFPSGVFLQGDHVWVTDTLQFDRMIKFRPVVDDKGRVVDITKIMQIPSAPTPSSSQSASSNKSNEQKDQIFNTPADIVVLDNRSLWVTEHGPSLVTEFNLTSKQIKKYPTSSSSRHLTTLPYWISTGSNDNTSFWFNEHVGNRMAYFNTTSMTLTEYEVPTRNATNGYIANALTLSVDPTNNNRVWFTEFNNDKIGMVNLSVPIWFDIEVPPSSRELTLLIPEEAKQDERMDMQQENQKQELQQQLPNQQIQNITIPVTLKYNLDNNNHGGSKEVHTDNNSDNINKLILLNTSSSMSPSGKFVNMTASFLPSPIIEFSNVQLNSNNINEVETNVELRLSSYSNTPRGNFTLGISATDGKVTKTDYVDIIAK
jgi:streptogramin lyase